MLSNPASIAGVIRVATSMLSCTKGQAQASAAEAVVVVREAVVPLWLQPALAAPEIA